ncbi:MAG: FIVAR domain-containing protein [Clostridia bacterium]|nr:FIVAR domain-containing protein [Clostridia bacterium]
MNAKKRILIMLVTVVAILFGMTSAVSAEVATPELRGASGETLTLTLRYEQVYSVEFVLSFSHPEYIAEVAVVNSATTLTMSDYNAKEGRFGGIIPEIVDLVTVTFHIKLSDQAPANQNITLTIKEQAIGRDKVTWEAIDLPDETVNIFVVERLDFTILNQLLAEATALDESKYTAQSWDVLEKALGEARIAATNSKTQSEINAAADALREAIKALEELPPPPPIDYSALMKQITIAEGLKASDYTSASYAKVKSALKTAKNMLTSQDQSKVDAAAQNLKDAIAGLVKVGATEDPDYYELNRQIAIAEALVEEKYTPNSWSRMQKALTNAKNALNSKDQSVIDAAATALKDAIAALEELNLSVDYSELRKQLAIAETLKAGHYTEESWNGLLAAMEVAQNALNSDEQAVVDAATEGLKNAIAGLVEINVQVLLDALAKLQEHIQNEEISYLWNEMHALLNEVNAALESRDPATIEDCATRLLALLAQIEDKLAELRTPETVVVDKPTPSAPTDDYCNIEGHRIWPILFWISLALNVAGVAYVVVFFVMKRKKTTDDTPLIDYDITDDES